MAGGRLEKSGTGGTGGGGIPFVGGGVRPPAGDAPSCPDETTAGWNGA